jgi:phosphate transport system permease protein
MQLATRKVMDSSFTGLGVFSTLLVAAALVVLLAPIVLGGLRAFVFRATVEHRRLVLEQFGRGSRTDVRRAVTAYVAARNTFFARLDALRDEHIVTGAARWRLPAAERAAQQAWAEDLDALAERLEDLFGPRRALVHHLHDLLSPEQRAQVEATEAGRRLLSTDTNPHIAREQYGATRWDQAQARLRRVVYREKWVSPGGGGDTTQMLVRREVPRAADFSGTPLAAPVAALIGEVQRRSAEIFEPRWTIYWRFLFDPDVDSHVFGGIWAEVLGTLYLTLGAILFAVPMGIISAIYLVEYAPDNWWIGLLRSCVSTLAGVPSIVFGLFGLAFFINWARVSGWFMPPGSDEVPSKSVLAGSLTLAVLILPVIIRASEEAIRAVPQTYKEAALSVGAGKWRTIMTVVLPAALPGILTGIVISMGRAAGETAPIIFTAAVSFGQPLQAWETLTRGTPALPWNIFNLCTEHQAADEIRHVQYGMVLTLVALVLVLNGAAIIMRARISRKLTG